MSHTNSTAHYELPQFLGTDKPAWLTDINGAMSAIDTGIYSAQTKANEADAKATQNTSDITTQGGQITTLSGKVSALETAQPLDEAQIELNRQNIATNAQNIVEIDNRLGHVDISAYGSTQTGAIKNIGDKAVNKCVTTDEETIGQPSLKAYAIGEFFIGKTDRNLYKVTSAISISDVLAVGTNCSVDTIASELVGLKAEIVKVPTSADNGTDLVMDQEYTATDDGVIVAMVTGITGHWVYLFKNGLQVASAIAVTGMIGNPIVYIEVKKGEKYKFRGNTSPEFSSSVKFYKWIY